LRPTPEGSYGPSRVRRLRFAGRSKHQELRNMKRFFALTRNERIILTLLATLLAVGILVARML